MRRTRDLGPLLSERYGRPARKICLKLGTSCPHRGANDPQGCIFCAEGPSSPHPPVAQQLQRGLTQLKPGTAAIAYLQDHTATLLPPEQLDRVLRAIRADPQVAAITIGTRPDCLPPAILEVLEQHAAGIDLLVELGLQSANDATLRLINRGHTSACFAVAVKELHRRKLAVCAHVILGLPKPRPPNRGQALALEDRADVVATARLLAALQVEAVKLHNCHVLEGTALAQLHTRGLYRPPDLEGYIELLIPFLEHLPRKMEIHRLMGEAHPPALIAPGFTGDKSGSLLRIRRELEIRDTYQGRLAEE